MSFSKESEREREERWIEQEHFRVPLPPPRNPIEDVRKDLKSDEVEAALILAEQQKAEQDGGGTGTGVDGQRCSVGKNDNSPGKILSSSSALSFPSALSHLPERYFTPGNCSVANSASGSILVGKTS